jgi:hypothetical protein
LAAVGFGDVEPFKLGVAGETLGEVAGDETDDAGIGVGGNEGGTRGQSPLWR